MEARSGSGGTSRRSHVHRKLASDKIAVTYIRVGENQNGHLRFHSVVPTPRTVPLIDGDVAFDARWTLDDNNGVVQAYAKEHNVQVRGFAEARLEQ